jgi:hypothetical protein
MGWIAGTSIAVLIYAVCGLVAIILRERRYTRTLEDKIRKRQWHAGNPICSRCGKPATLLPENPTLYQPVLCVSCLLKA